MGDTPGWSLTKSKRTEEQTVDFGEILKLWEASGRPAVDPAGKPGVEKPVKPLGKGAGRAGNVSRLQSEWLDRHGVPDGTGPGFDDQPQPRLSNKEIEAMPIDASLDLHGMTTREASVALAEFFRTAESMGCRKVLLVHGKGLHSSAEPVLEGFVKRWLENRASAGRSGHADAANGGKGATWVLLKQPRLLKQQKDQRSR